MKLNCNHSQHLRNQRSGDPPPEQRTKRATRRPGRFDESTEDELPPKKTKTAKKSKSNDPLPVQHKDHTVHRSRDPDVESEPTQPPMKSKKAKSNGTPNSLGTSEVKIMFLNVSGTLSSHADELARFVDAHEPDFLFLCETGISKVQAQKFPIRNNYTVSYLIPSTGKRRGIAVLIADKWLPFLATNDLKKTHVENLSVIHITVQNIAKPFHIIGAYASPNARASYWADFRSWYKKTIPRDSRAIVIGDLNQAPDGTRDREVQPGSNPQPPCAEFAMLLRDDGLIDMWRRLHDAQVKYSFIANRKLSSGAIQPKSRIDLVLCTPNLGQRIQHCELGDMPTHLAADHFPIETILRLSQPIANMPAGSPQLPETCIELFDVANLSDPVVREAYAASFDQEATKHIEAAPSAIAMYTRLIDKIGDAAHEHVKTRERILNRRWDPPKECAVSRSHSHAITVLASKLQLLAEIGPGKPFRHTNAIQKLVRNATTKFPIEPPPHTEAMEPAVEWFDSVAKTLEKMREHLCKRKQVSQRIRIAEAMERADDDYLFDPSHWYKRFQRFKAASTGKKVQVNVINEVDPKQNEFPEYEDSSPQGLKKGTRKYWQGAATDRICEDDPESPWLSDEFRAIRTAADAKYKGELIAPITLEALDEALKRIPDGKAHGPDDIPVELLRHLPENIRRLLAGLFSTFVNDCKTPDAWRHCRIFTLHKTGDVSRCSNYRPISLQSVVYKTFSSILTHRLSKWVEDNHLLSNSQGGFRRGRTCIEKTQLLTKLTEQLKKEGKEVHIVFADVKKAYDSVPINRLARALRVHKIDDQFIDLIQNVYTNNTADVITVHGVTDSFDVLRGVKQGDPMSCLLFTLFLEPGIDWVHRYLKLHSGEALAFADDVALIAVNRDHLQTATLMLQWYFHHNGLELGVSDDKSKTVYMTTHPDGNDIAIRSVTTHMQDHRYSLSMDTTARLLPKLSQRQSYKYLGVWWNVNLDFSDHLNRSKGKLHAALNYLTQSHYNRQQAVTLINTVIIPAMSFGFEVTHPSPQIVKDWDDAVKRSFNRKCGIHYSSTPHLHYLSKDMMGEGLLTFAYARDRALLTSLVPRGANSADTSLASVMLGTPCSTEQKEILDRLKLSVIPNEAQCAESSNSLELLFLPNSHHLQVLRDNNIPNTDQLIDKKGMIRHRLRKATADIQAACATICVDSTWTVLPHLLRRLKHSAFPPQCRSGATSVFTDGSCRDAAPGKPAAASYAVTYKHADEEIVHSASLPSHYHSVETEAVALAVATAMQQHDSDLTIYTDSEVNIKRLERLEKTGSLPKNIPIEAIEQIHTVLAVKKAKEAKGKKLELKHILSHSDDNTMPVDERKRRKEKIKQLYGDDAPRIVEGNKAADTAAKMALDKPTPHISPFSTDLPLVLFAKQEDKTLVSDLSREIKQHHSSASLQLMMRKRSKNDKERYQWLEPASKALISWRHSTLIVKNKNPALNRLQNFLIRARRGLFLCKKELFNRLKVDRNYWLKRAGGVDVQNPNCDLCGDPEEKWHFIKCKAHNARRQKTTNKIIAVINKNLTPASKISDIPIFWAQELKHHDANRKKLWRQIEQIPLEQSAMGLIPTAFVTFLRTLRWRTIDDIDVVLERTQLLIAEMHHKSWKERCRVYTDAHRPQRNLEHAAAVRQKIADRLKQRKQRKTDGRHGKRNAKRHHKDNGGQKASPHPS